MSSTEGKGKGVDWKATAEMLSSTPTAHPSQEDEADNYAAAEAVEAILTTSPDHLHPPDGLPTPAREEAMKEFNTIKLIYDLDEMKAPKANHLRFSTIRSAPPPPYRTIAPKTKPAKGLLNTSYDVADERLDMEMTDLNEVDELKEGWHTTIQRSLRRMRTADSASLRVLTSTPEPEPEYISLERWECHECNLSHPIDIDDSGWDSHDPNICKCCNHDRCGKCWDLDENGWRIQFCDGSSLGH